jgi:hypothetical protein
LPGYFQETFGHGTTVAVRMSRRPRSDRAAGASEPSSALPCSACDLP